MERMKHKTTTTSWTRCFRSIVRRVPDPEPSAGFMPGLWQRIEARAPPTFGCSAGWAQVCVVATVALTAADGRGPDSAPPERSRVYSASYVDVLAADHPND